MARFVAFDVETPNRLNHRMSAIGITVVEDGEIKENFYSLVDPETHFDPFNTQLTGISAQSVQDAPTFSDLWPVIRPLLESGLLVAHNAVFDLSVLKKCLAGYDIFWRPYVKYLCTVQMGRRLLPGQKHGLDAMCSYYGIPLDHHHAASDSQACARILLAYIAAGAELGPFIRTCRLLA